MPFSWFATADYMGTVALFFIAVLDGINIFFRIGLSALCACYSHAKIKLEIKYVTFEMR
jgi:hypothetical protein